MTNRENVIRFLGEIGDDELAEYLVFAEESNNTHDTVYVCMDGSKWYCYEDAINHTADWLKEGV